MKKVLFFLALSVGFFSSQAQITGMSVVITGPTTGVPLSATVAVSSNFNGYGVSCALAATGPNTNGTVLVTVTGGSANYTYDLFTGSTAGATGAGNAGTAGTVNQAAVTNTFAGLLGTVGAGSPYTAKVTDANNCVAVIATPTVNVTAPANLTASLSGLITDLCQTNSGSITVNAAGGVVNGVTPGATTPAGSGNGYDVTWTVTSPFLNGFAGPSNINPATSPQLITTDPGTKVFTQMSGNTQFNFVVTDDNGCVVQ